MHLLLLLLGCTNDGQLNKGDPKLELSPDHIDFGEIVVGNQAEVGLTVRNGGYGHLDFDALHVADTSSPDFRITTWPEEGLDYGEEGVLGVRYTPDVEGQDFGAVELATNDPAAVGVSVAVEGTGVAPDADVDPETLWFGTLPEGGSATLPVRINAAGTGDLRVSSISFPRDEPVAYAFAVPEDYVEPYTVANGLGFTVDVTFTPPTTSAYEGELWIATNDPDEPLSIVRLQGNVPDDPDTNVAPVVEILDPNNGRYFLDDTTVALSGTVHDPDEPVTNLLCGWYADGVPVAAVIPQPDGAIVSTGVLPAGNPVALQLRCLDSEGAVGEDVASVTVWRADAPMTYTISGGDSTFDWLAVDDDLAIELNGAPAYTDADGTRSNLAPISIEAAVGDTLRVVLTDQNSCDAGLVALTLHWGTGDHQALNDAFCISACPDHPCYDPAYDGPWPGTAFEGTYTIGIP
jgi:hypothetical protein